jgi:hypothetical protein
MDLFDHTVRQTYIAQMAEMMLKIRYSVTLYSQGSTHHQPNGMSIAILAFLQAAIVLFPAVAIALPTPSPHSWETDVPMALITMTNMVVAPLIAPLQIYAQYREYRRQSGDAGALSLLSHSTQMPVLTILVVRLFIRLGEPPRVPRQNYGPQFALWAWDSLQVMYSWGMLAINYTVCAVGYTFLLSLYLFSRYHGTDGASTPLLS